MENSFRYQKEGIAKDIIGFLMRDYGWSLSKAIEVLYESETYKKISQPETGLYYQGSLYLYTFLQTEIETGVMG